MRKIRWEKGYEGFAWGCLVAAAALLAGAAIAGCHIHFHAFEKHYHDQGTKGLRDEGTEGAEPRIEANPRGERGIKIVIPNGKE